MSARTFACACVSALLSMVASAATGKLPLTGGVASVDGAGGGGLTPWATTATLATADRWGAAGFVSALRTRDFALGVAGAALAWGEDAEVTLARQELDAGDQLAALGLRGLRLRQDVVGLKLRLAGDAVLDADRPWPQVSAGLLHKRVHAGALAPTLHGVLGASRSDHEFYVSATKLWLGPGLLLNLTLRQTRANQGGLLGFGSAADPRRRWMPELSAGWLPARHVVLGAEWRRKGQALRRSALGEGALAEDDWRDVFVAWAPWPRLSLTAALVDLGRIAPGVQPRRQRGAYLSLQAAF
ncbi:MAG: DUF3034 family protein [Rubrivivax sp.]